MQFVPQRRLTCGFEVRRLCAHKSFYRRVHDAARIALRGPGMPNAAAACSCAPAGVSTEQGQPCCKPAGLIRCLGGQELRFTCPQSSAEETQAATPHHIWLSIVRLSSLCVALCNQLRILYGCALISCLVHLLKERTIHVGLATGLIQAGTIRLEHDSCCPWGCHQQAWRQELGAPRLLRKPLRL